MVKEKKEIPQEEEAVKLPSKCTTDLKSINVDGTLYKTKLTPAFLRRKPYVPYNPNRLFSFIPGTIQKVYVEEGQKVTAGMKVMILEAMKMRNEIRSPINGVVKTLNVRTGELVSNKYFLIEFSEE
jgi:biotin carboxyl carrier protein